MKRPLNNLQRGLLAGGLIFNLLITCPPLGMAAVLCSGPEESVDLPSCPLLTRISDAEIAAGVPSFMPKSSQETEFLLVKRLRASAVARSSRIVWWHESRLIVELHEYPLANDLHFNQPRVSFRQPSGEHSPAG